MRSILIFAALVVAAGVYVARIAERQPPPTALAAQSEPPPSTNGSNSRSVTLNRGNGGHFWTDARIDGRRLELVVDTGASTITLRASDAARLGIHPTAREYNVKVSTANGVTKAALVQLQRVEIGDIVVHNVPALVHTDDTLGVNLLGMSFLSRIRWTHERGKLILEQ
jgi:aspartyl protease family protein